MKSPLLIRLSPIFAIFALGMAVEATSAEVDFVHQIVPILKQHCIDCHGGDKAKGGFSINTRLLFLDDDTAKPGDAAASYFLELIEGTDPEVQMPPGEKAACPRPAGRDPEAVGQRRHEVGGGIHLRPTDLRATSATTHDPELPAITDHRENPVDRFIDHYLARWKNSPARGNRRRTFLRRIPPRSHRAASRPRRK